MKQITLWFALALAAFAIVGCDHSTNNLTPPPGSELTITSPADDSVVSGIVTVSVNTSALDRVSRVELYINGEIAQAKTAPPWQFEWNTSNLPRNSFHSLYTKGYNFSSKYSVSQTILVRIN
jgi:hypothetical protein